MAASCRQTGTEATILSGNQILRVT